MLPGLMSPPPARSAAAHNTLDDVHALRLAGKADEAMRLAIALLEADANQLGAAVALAQLLIAEGRSFLAAEVAGRLVDAFTRRGDLPHAMVAAAAAESGGEDGELFRKTIAAAFGKGSNRIADVHLPPPPLPPDASIPASLASLSADALHDRAESALQTYLATDDTVPPKSKIPAMPLFSGLEPKALVMLLGALKIVDVEANELVIEQGEEGHDAFVLVRGQLHVEREDGENVTVLAGLGPGSIFGEMALVSDAPRAASVRAHEPSTLLVAPREDLERIAAKTPAIGEQLSSFCRARMLANLMRHSAILRAVEPASRHALMERFETERFEEGATLIEEGSDGDGLYLVASGGVEVIGNDSDGDQIRIAELGPGNVVGEISLVLRRPANATVRAAHPTVALHLTREEFHSAIREHPTLLAELYDMATQREEETASVVAQEAFDVEDIVLL